MHTIRLAICTVVIVFAAPLAEAAPELREPSIQCRFRAQALLLSLHSPWSTPVQVSWRGNDISGRRVGGEGAYRGEVKRGPNEIALTVQPALDYRVEVRINGRSLQRLCQRDRGEWAAGPPELNPKTTVETFEEAGPLVGDGDVKLGQSFGATARANPGGDALVVERTFGARTQHGIRPPRGGALVLVARGTVGPVRLSAAERVAPGTLRYWDYFLVLEPRFRRYLVPLADLRFRGPKKLPMTTLHSLAIQSSLPAVVGSQVEVAAIGIAAQGPRLGPMVRGPEGVSVTVTGGGGRPAVVRWSGVAARAPVGERAVTAPGKVRIDDKAAHKIWLCWQERGKVEVCDPPDAPLSRYLLPALAGQPLVVDDFETRASVNAHRQPLDRFASSHEVERSLRTVRSAGALRLRASFRAAGEYAGILTDLPTVPAELRSLELRLRGDASPAGITVGVRDEKGREPRLVLGSYLPKLGHAWSVVRLPLRAFRAAYAGFGGKGKMGKPRRLAIALVADGPSERTLEIGSIRFVPERGPVTIATFDGPRPKVDDLAGLISKETAAAAGLRMDLQASGARGKGLGVTVSRIGGPSYALVALGLGGLDATGLRTLVLRVRGARGGETVDLVLQRDRHERARIPLRRYASVTTAWQTVRVPLADFAALGLDLDRLDELVLLWGDRSIAAESMFFDELALE